MNVEGRTGEGARPVPRRGVDRRPSLGPAGGGSLMSDPSEPAAELPETVATGLPADLLQDGETILLLLKPHPLYIVLGCLGPLSLLAAIAIGSFILPRYWEIERLSDQAMAGLCLFLAGVVLSWQLLEWMSRTYILTDRRVIRIMGIVRVQMFQAELRRLQHTQLLFSLRERIFGLGTISFSTAGPSLPEAYWVMVAQPLAVHKKVLHAIERYGR
jgi:hypothetical protein